jgi:hypothetical protein
MRALVTVTDPSGQFEPEEREVCLRCEKRPCHPGELCCPGCIEIIEEEFQNLDRP